MGGSPNPDMSAPFGPSTQSDDKERRRRRYLLRQFWTSALQYWRSGPRPCVLTASLVFVIVVTVGVQYLLNLWNRAFFNALEGHNGSAVLTTGLLFPVLAAASVATWGLAVKLRLATQRSWRAWLDNDVPPAGSAKDDIFSSTSSAATTRTPNIASPKTCGSRPSPPSISPPAFCRRGSPQSRS